jgi:hypothetical protein
MQIYSEKLEETWWIHMEKWGYDLHWCTIAKLRINNQGGLTFTDPIGIYIIS